MILVAGLTPAWQQILVLTQFLPGEVNRARIAQSCASGKVLNVGCALHHLGAEAQTVCLIGGEVGQQVRREMEKLSIPVYWIESQTPTRTCTTILDETNRTTTELVENSREISEEELEAYFRAYCNEVPAASVVVLTGSLPLGTPPNYFRRLLEQTKAQAVLDIRGPELDEALKTGPLLVKPNREELARTVGRVLDTEEELLAAMAEIRSRGAEWAVVSQGADPLLALGPHGLIRISPPQVTTVNPIGCGDCLAAGIAAALDLHFSMDEALEIGVRAAAENAQALLPARSLSRIA